MKLLTLSSNGEFHPAVLLGAQVLDLRLARKVVPIAKEVPDSMRALLAGGTRIQASITQVLSLAQDSQTRARLEDLGALVPFTDASLGPVVPDPDLILAGSMNSRGHVAEMHDEPPEWPCAFHKVKSALCASGEQIITPDGHDQMIDWEGEICVVIGTKCHRVEVAHAMGYVAGYTLMNDVSAREFVAPFVTAKGAAPTAQAWERNVLGKNFPTFCPLGPVILTRDELPGELRYHMVTRVNGHVMQSSTEEDLVFGPAEMIAYFSQFLVFQPGDIISMGSPPGVGMARKPQLFLKPGDLVEVEVPQIGTLSNTLAARRAS